MTGQPRVPRLAPSELDAHQRAVYDGIVGGRRAAGPQFFELVDGQGRLNGPFAALVCVPAVGEAVSRLGEAIRYETQLSNRAREIAILAVAARHRDEFEWYAHAPIARSMGIDDGVLDALVAGVDPNLDDPAERVTYRLAAATATGAGVSDADWRAAVEELGESQAIEVTAVVGYYTMLSLMMTAQRVGQPEGVEPTFRSRAAP